MSQPKETQYSLLKVLLEFKNELTELLREQQANEAFLAKRPNRILTNWKKELAEVLAKLELNKEEVSQVEKSLSPLRRTIVSLSEKLSDARLESARLSGTFSVRFANGADKKSRDIFLDKRR